MRKKNAYGWSELITGILLIVLGIMTISRPFNVLSGIVSVYGILAIITGIIDIVFYIKTEQRTGFGPTVSLVTGIIGIFAGVLLLFRPGIGSWTLIMLFPLWFIVHCISRLTHLPMIRYTAGTGYYYFSLVINIIGLIMGFIMIINPMVSLFSVGYLIGGYLILSGIDHIVLAVYELRA